MHRNVTSMGKPSILRGLQRDLATVSTSSVVGDNSAHKDVKGGQLTPGGECLWRAVPIGRIGVAVSSQVKQSVILH